MRQSLLGLSLVLAAAIKAAAMTPPSLAASVAPRSPMMGLARRTERGVGAALMGWQSSRNQRQSGTTKADNPNQEKTNSWRTTLLLDYSPSLRWNAILSVPYHRTRASFANTEQSADGIGDIALIGKYALFQDRSPFKRREIFALFGFDLPTGETNLKDAQGIRLPATLQPGSNSADLIAGGSAAWSLEHFSFYGDLNYRYNTDRAYTFGDIFGINLGIHYPLPKAPIFSFSAEVGAQFIGRDTSDLEGPGVYANKIVRDSGAELVFFSPGAQWDMGRGLSLSAGVQLPVHQNFRGTQLASQTDYVLSLSGRF